MAADMQLISRSNDCWSTHILYAMEGLTVVYLQAEAAEL
jgi:hypothetical protein